RYMGYMALMAEVIDLQNKSMVGSNMSLDQILQQEAGNSSSAEGVDAAVDNMVALKTDLGG
ncbi:hypothetical protein D1615_29965, partial [Klebsiella pneumoniae]|uniref:hypothetical protein n=1 Tax=Klebsiella pneumoniae TaxID=573 RepID=UPI000FF248F0